MGVVGTQNYLQPTDACEQQVSRRDRACVPHVPNSPRHPSRPLGASPRGHIKDLLQTRQPARDRQLENKRQDSWAVRCEVQAAKMDTRGWHHHQPVPRPVWENTGFAAIPVGRGLELHLPGLSLPCSQGAHFLATPRRKVKSQTVQLKPTVTEPGWSF